MFCFNLLFKFIKEETHFYIINHKSDLACFSGRDLPERRGFSTLRSSAPAEPQLWAKRLAPLPPQWLHAESASWTSYPAQRGDMHQLPRRVPARSQSPHTSQSLEVSSVWLLFLILMSCPLRYLLPNLTPPSTLLCLLRKSWDSEFGSDSTTYYSMSYICASVDVYYTL